MAASDKTPVGRKADKIIRDALLAVSRNEPTKIKRLAEKWWDMALEGDMQAIEKLTDRIDGKAIQAVDMNVTKTILEEAVNERYGVEEQDSR